MIVGIAAIGYADGYPRSIKKGTCCIVEGRRCQIVGVVSMDLIHIDLSECPDATLGSMVEFWGKQMQSQRLPNLVEGSAMSYLLESQTG